VIRQRAAMEILNREFLEIRCKVLELAAAFDRLERGAGGFADDPRWRKINEALEVLRDDRGDRAERVQLIFSRPYASQWREEFALDRPE
jgi:hypothetical protein